MKLRLAASSTCALFIVALSASDATAQWVSTNGPAGAQTNAFTFRDGGTTLLAGTGGGGVFRANSPYTTWTRMNNGLTTTNVLSMATGVNEWGYETLLAGTQGGGIFAAWPNGANWGFGNWSAWNRGLPNGVVRAVTAVPDPYFGYGMVLFAGNDSGVFRSNIGDVRIGWAPINTGLTNTLVRALAYIFDGSDENDGIGANDLFVGTSGGGVFLSTDGVRWWPKNTGLTNKNVSALAGSSTYGMLFAGTVGGGVFRSTYTWGGWTRDQQRADEHRRAGPRRRGHNRLCGNRRRRRLRVHQRRPGPLDGRQQRTAESRHHRARDGRHESVRRDRRRRLSAAARRDDQPIVRRSGDQEILISVPPVSALSFNRFWRAFAPAFARRLSSICAR